MQSKITPSKLTPSLSIKGQRAASESVVLRRLNPGGSLKIPYNCEVTTYQGGYESKNMQDIRSLKVSAGGTPFIIDDRIIMATKE